MRGYADVPGIKITLPRQRSHHESIERYKFIPGQYSVLSPSQNILFTATRAVKKKRLPTMEHMIPVPKVNKKYEEFF